MTKKRCKHWCLRWRQDKTAHAQLFTTYLVSDYPWLRDLVGTDAEAWVDAIEAIDLRGDKKPLLELLMSERSIPKAARLVLTDMLARYQLKRRPGHPKIAGYMLTPQHIKMQSARAHYKKLRGEKMKPKAALKRAAENVGVLQSELEKYLSGRIPRYRRHERRIEALRSE